MGKFFILWYSAYCTLVQNLFSGIARIDMESSARFVAENAQQIKSVLYASLLNFAEWPESTQNM